MEELVRSTNSNTRERILSSQLKEVSMEQGASTSGSIVKLTTGSSQTIVARLGNTNQKPPPTFSNEVLNRLQLKTRLSDNKMKVADNFLRVKCGRSSVVCHEKFMLIEIDDILTLSHQSNSKFLASQVTLQLILRL